MTKQKYTQNPSAKLAADDPLRIEIARMQTAIDIMAALNARELFGTTESVLFHEIFLCMRQVERALGRKGRRA